MPFTIELNQDFNELLDDAFARMDNSGEAFVHFGAKGCTIRRTDKNPPYRVDEITFKGDVQVHFFHTIGGNHGQVKHVPPSERFRNFFILLFGTGSFSYDGRFKGHARNTYMEPVQVTRRPSTIKVLDLTL